jgi:hypothetical protein
VNWTGFVNAEEFLQRHFTAPAALYLLAAFKIHLPVVVIPFGHAGLCFAVFVRLRNKAQRTGQPLNKLVNLAVVVPGDVYRRGSAFDDVFCFFDNVLHDYLLTEQLFAVKT